MTIPGKRKPLSPKNRAEIAEGRPSAAGFVRKHWKALAGAAAFSICAALLYILFHPDRSAVQDLSAVTRDYPGWLECTGTDWEALGSCRFVPQYNRKIKTAVMTLATDQRDLSLQDEILMRLPSYSKVYVLLSRENLSAVRTWVRNKKYRKKLHFVTYEDERGDDVEYYEIIKPDTVLERHRPGGRRGCERRELR